MRHNFLIVRKDEIQGAIQPAEGVEVERKASGCLVVAIFWAITTPAGDNKKMSKSLRFLQKLMLYEKEEKRKLIWALILLFLGILILYFNPISEEGWGWIGGLLLVIAGGLLGSIPNPPVHPDDPFNFLNKK